MTDDAAQRRKIEVVHVRVSEENSVDGRQVCYACTCAALTAQDDQRARKDGVDEDVAACDLDEERGVADEGNAEFAGRDDARWLRIACERCAMGVVDDAGELSELADYGWVLSGRHGCCEIRCAPDEDSCREGLFSGEYGKGGRERSCVRVWFSRALCYLEPVEIWDVDVCEAERDCWERSAWGGMSPMPGSVRVLIGRFYFIYRNIILYINLLFLFECISY